jgi:acyl-CoA thioester hydrolase
MAGHVHNGVYLHYFELARMNFFVQQLGKDWDWKANGLILKKNTVEYKIPTLLQDKIAVDVWTSHIGNTSFTLSYRIIDQDGNEKTYGESVLVCFNYLINKPIPIPAQMKSVLEKHLSK